MFAVTYRARLHMLRSCSHADHDVLLPVLLGAGDDAVAAYVRLGEWSPPPEFTAVLQAHLEARELELAEALAEGGEGKPSITVRGVEAYATPCQCRVSSREVS